MSALTAEQVRTAIFNNSSYANYDGAIYYADGIRMQAIADELNSQAERTCEVLGEDYDELLEYWETELSCGHVFNGMAEYVNYCPKCGAKVVRE